MRCAVGVMVGWVTVVMETPSRSTLQVYRPVCLSGGMRTDRGSRVLPSIALVVLWSSGFIGAELGTRQAPASALLAWRYLVAGGILVALCAWRRERIDRSGLRRQVVLG